MKQIFQNYFVSIGDFQTLLIFAWSSPPPSKPPKKECQRIKNVCFFGALQLRFKYFLCKWVIWKKAYYYEHGLSYFSDKNCLNFSFLIIMVSSTASVFFGTSQPLRFWLIFGHEFLIEMSKSQTYRIAFAFAGVGRFT